MAVHNRSRLNASKSRNLISYGMQAWHSVTSQHASQCISKDIRGSSFCAAVAFARFAENELHFSSHAQHFGDHFLGECRTCFCESPCQDWVRWAQHAKPAQAFILWHPIARSIDFEVSNCVVHSKASYSKTFFWSLQPWFEKNPPTTSSFWAFNMSCNVSFRSSGFHCGIVKHFWKATRTYKTVQFFRMYSKGSKEFGRWRAWSLDVAQLSATVRNHIRNRPRSTAWGRYGRASAAKTVTSTNV